MPQHRKGSGSTPLNDPQQLIWPDTLMRIRFLGQGGLEPDSPSVRCRGDPPAPVRAGDDAALPRARPADLHRPSSAPLQRLCLGSSALDTAAALLEEGGEGPASGTPEGLAGPHGPARASGARDDPDRSQQRRQKQPPPPVHPHSSHWSPNWGQGRCLQDTLRYPKIPPRAPTLHKHGRWGEFENLPALFDHTTKGALHPMPPGGEIQFDVRGAAPVSVVFTSQTEWEGPALFYEVRLWDTVEVGRVLHEPLPGEGRWKAREVVRNLARRAGAAPGNSAPWLGPGMSPPVVYGEGEPARGADGGFGVFPPAASPHGPGAGMQVTSDLLPNGLPPFVGIPFVGAPGFDPLMAGASAASPGGAMGPSSFADPDRAPPATPPATAPAPDPEPRAATVRSTAVASVCLPGLVSDGDWASLWVRVEHNRLLLGRMGKIKPLLELSVPEASTLRYVGVLPPAAAGAGAAAAGAEYDFYGHTSIRPLCEMFIADGRAPDPQVSCCTIGPVAFVGQPFLVTVYGYHLPAKGDKVRVISGQTKRIFQGSRECTELQGPTRERFGYVTFTKEGTGIPIVQYDVGNGEWLDVPPKDGKGHVIRVHTAEFKGPSERIRKMTFRRKRDLKKEDALAVARGPKLDAAQQEKINERLYKGGYTRVKPAQEVSQGRKLTQKEQDASVSKLSPVPRKREIPGHRPS